MPVPSLLIAGQTLFDPELTTLMAKGDIVRQATGDWTLVSLTRPPFDGHVLIFKAFFLLVSLSGFLFSSHLFKDTMKLKSDSLSLHHAFVVGPFVCLSVSCCYSII